MGLRKIQQELQAKANLYAEYDEDQRVDVFIPKFTTESHFTLSPILKNVSLITMLHELIELFDLKNRFFRWALWICLMPVQQT